MVSVKTGIWMLESDRRQLHNHRFRGYGGILQSKNRALLRNTDTFELSWDGVFHGESLVADRVLRYLLHLVVDR